MSVLVKGMKMPESCRDCPLKCDDGFYYFFCGVTKEECAFAERRDDCPLVPVPPHGRLVDADELFEHVWRDKLDSRELIARMIDNAPTIIQASGG